MYIAVQHVRNAAGLEDVHAYVHLHDVGPAQAFPIGKPLSVPEAQRGVLVYRAPHSLMPGGNAVLSYLDVIAEDAVWRANFRCAYEGLSQWFDTLRAVSELMTGRPLPWVFASGEVHFVLNAVDELSPAREYQRLLDKALDAWNEAVRSGRAPS
jgi:hypothetical protein